MNDTNDTVVIDEGDTSTDEITEEDTTDWKAEAIKFQGLAKRRGTQLGKVKTKLGEYEQTVKALSQKAEPPPVKKEEPKSTELDYSQKAFLLAKGIEEFDLVLEEAMKFGGDLKNVKLEQLIENPYFKQRLETVRTTKANELAASGDSGRGGSAGGRNTPDYWLNKLGPNEQVPADLPRELREKIVEARTAKSREGKMFYND